MIVIILHSYIGWPWVYVKMSVPKYRYIYIYRFNQMRAIMISRDNSRYPRKAVNHWV